MAAKRRTTVTYYTAERRPSEQGGPEFAFPITTADYNMGRNGGPSVVRRADVEAVSGPLAAGHEPNFGGEELDDD